MWNIQSLHDMIIMYVYAKRIFKVYLFMKNFYFLFVCINEIILFKSITLDHSIHVLPLYRETICIVTLKPMD